MLYHTREGRVTRSTNSFTPTIDEFATHNPGMFVRNEEKLQQMEKRKGKTGMEGFGPG